MSKGRHGRNLRMTKQRLTPDQEREAHDLARAKRLFTPTARRRPEDVAFIRSWLTSRVPNPDVNPVLDSENAVKEQLQQTVTNDYMIMSMAKQPDTVLYFGTDRLCDVLEATDSPDVVDLTPLLKIGNHTLAIGFAHNVKTDNPGLAICAAIIGIGKFRGLSEVDGQPIPRLFGQLVHEDQTISTFVARCDEVPGSSGDLGRINWTVGKNWRKEDTSAEHRIVSNILGLLGQAGKLFTSTEFKHYTKSEKSDAAAARRKLPPVNVIGLRSDTDKNLTEHHAAIEVERDHCWPVRGHFRQQPYGPGQQLRRLTYIGPHVKGNLNGPLISRPQVHRVG